MNIKAILLLVIVASVFLVGCQAETNGYGTYNQEQQQGQYVGGGCGVAPSGDYGETPVDSIDSEAAL